MRFTTEEQFKRILSGDLHEGVFFLCGNEPYLKKHYYTQLISRFSDDTGFNLQEFDSASDMQQLYNAVCQLPFMSERKCVTLCDADIEKLSEGSLKLLYESVDSIGDHCVLLIWYNTAEADLTKAKTKKLMEHIEQNGGVIVKLDKKQLNDIAKILCSGASKRYCKMDVQTARYMVDQCGDDLTNLVSELDKLCSYAGKGATVTNAHIDKVCVRTIDVKAYQLGSAITAGKTTEALELLDDLFYINYGPELILGAIVSPFADICRVRIKNDRPLSDVAADFSYGKREFILKNALYASNRLTDEQLNRCLNELTACDISIKSSVTSPRIALEQLTVTLCHIMSGR